MTAISKAWVTLLDAATDADSPVDQALVQGLRDDTVHLREWLGASYTAGAVQDHNHDGVNSALVEIGPNALRNGSFESGTASWTLAAYTGGTLGTNTANDMDGATCLAITSTVLANGGGTATSNAFNNCTGSEAIGFKVAYKASAANISSRAQVQWFDDTQTLISTSDIYTSTNTPTTQTTASTSLTAPATARYYKVVLTGGVPATGSGTGTVYFDGVVVGATSTLVYSAPLSWTTGTTKDVTGIPPSVNHIQITLDNMAFTGTFYLQIGDSGGLETSANDSISGNDAYLLSCLVFTYAEIHLRRHSGNIWHASMDAYTDGARVADDNGRKSLSDTLTQFRCGFSGGLGGSGTAVVSWE